MIRIKKVTFQDICSVDPLWENHQIYGHVRCLYTVLANPTNNACIQAYLHTFFCMHRYIHSHIHTHTP